MIGVEGYHTAFINERGGRKRLHQIKNLESVEWNRVRDQQSQAKVSLAVESASDQRDILGGIEPGRHELCIFRNEERVWEGPISLPTYKRDGVQIIARDITMYLDRTVMHAGYKSNYPTFAAGEKVIARIMRILQAELGGPGRKETLNPPYNILPFVVAHQFSTDAETARVTEPFQMTVLQHIDDLAAKAGIDYTVIGRALHLWDTSRPALGQTRTLTEADFLGDVYVSIYGMELTTTAFVTDGQGNVGSFGGNDDYYGEWETLENAYDETDDGPAPTQTELNSQARRNRNGRLPTPLQVRVPDNSSLVLNETLTIGDLVPGVYMEVRSMLNLREVSQMQKLNSVRVTETSKGEEINVSLYPASKSDEVPVA